MIEDKNFDEKLLNSIKEKNVAPKPRWHFILKEYAIWIVGAVFLIVSAVSFSLIIHMVRLFRFREFGLYQKAVHGPLEFIMLVVPLFWLAMLALFAAFVYYDFKKTKKGYRYPPILIIGIVLLASAGLGAVFARAGFGEIIDDAIGRSAPDKFYRQVINPHVQFWSEPENGRLMGLVISQSNENEFDVLDIKRKEWVLYIVESGKADAEMVEVGRPVRALGEMVSDNEFKAKEILPFGAGRGFIMKMRPAPGMPGMMFDEPGRAIPRIPFEENADDCVSKCMDVQNERINN
ncbi:MAG: hypothetical protein WC745_01420 [Patescibacteria group bacterium]|jgi:heme/copper-type cytochrome/quinol oxidase subunit 2